MKIGYACLCVAVEGTQLKSCIRKTATPEHLLSLAGENFAALSNMVDYNIANQIALYRISSDIVPFGSAEAAKLPWDEVYQDRLDAIAQRIADSGMRVSMHPGQYTVLNSPNLAVVRRAVEDLAYHARFLDALHLDATHKIILHVGGKYGDPAGAITRFISVYRDLSPAITRRLVLENDGSIFNIAEVLELCHKIGAPAVYDNLHNAIHPADPNRSDSVWVSLCRETWRAEDGAQKTHYSQQDPGKTRGAHSATIAIDPFLEYYHGLSGEKPDMMLEVKDKNRSAVKCVLCLCEPNQRMLESEWGRYKYSVLERSPADYQRIRELLKDKRSNNSILFYEIVESALQLPEDTGRAINALEHVWGYFSECASAAETKQYLSRRDGYRRGEVRLSQVKQYLYRLAQTYQQHYLLGSDYFLN